MTPNEIYGAKFDKSPVGGYRVDEVNRFLISVGDHVKDIEKERDDLENKLEVLADKLEEYRSDEESLRAAIVGAQKLGDNVVKESKLKAERILSEAQATAERILSEAQSKAETMLDDTRNSITTEQYALESIKASVVKFRRKILSMYEQQVMLINAIPFNEDDVVEMERPEFLRKKEHINSDAEALRYEEDDNIDEDFEDNIEQDEKSERNGKEQTKKSSHFGPLLFGEDFSLTRKE